MAQPKRFLIDNKNIIGFEDVPRTGTYTLFNIPYYKSWSTAKASTLECLQEQIEAVKTYDLRYQIAKKFNTAVNYTLLNADNESVGSIQCSRLRIAKVTIAGYCDVDQYGYYNYKEFAIKADWVDYPDPYMLGLTDVSTWVKFDVVCYDFTNVSPARYSPDLYKCNVWFNSTEPSLVMTKDGSSVSNNLGIVVCGIDSYQEFTTDPSLESGWYNILYLPHEAPDGNNGGTFVYDKIDIGVLCSYLTSANVLRLDYADSLSNYSYPPANPPYWAQFTGGHYQTIDISDVVNLDGQPIPEDGYMNELMNRFSPRYWAGSLGIYLIGTDDIADVMQALMEVDASDVLANIFFGSDGKEYIVGLRWYYGLLQASGHTQGEIHMSANKIEVKVGNAKLDLNNVPIYEHIATREFATWTSSELSVPAHFNNYLDFMSRYQIYIPYYGFLDIAANDIVGGTVQLIYNINLVTGVADIVVACKNSRTGNLKTKCYTVSAKIGIDVPFGADMMKTMDVAWAQTCGKAFMTGATLGTGMAMANAMESVSQANSALSNIDLDTAEGRDAANNVMKVRDSAQASVNRSQFTKAILNDLNVKSVDTPHRSGGTNDESGSLDELHPYLLITRPVSVEPSNYADYVGVPSAASKKLSTCSGFTQIAAVKPEALTNAPKYVNEIISLLQAGVYL